MDHLDELRQELGPGYVVNRELARGGMSHVFLARDAALKRDIVVKLLRPELVSSVSVERFKREIELAASLQHPHIVPLLATGTVNGLPFYTMPFVRGESLRERLARSGRLPIIEAIHLLRDVASALAHAHGEGVVHRDIKPENIMMTGSVAVVTDFGVAKAVKLATTDVHRESADLTSTGIPLGTPAYMSPEQASADPSVDHRSDIYAFGCVAYEVLSGEHPFGARPPQEMLAAHLLEPAEPIAAKRAETPAAVAQMVMRCLEKRPANRPQSASEVLIALDSVTTPSGPPGTRSRRVVRTRQLTLAGVVAAVAGSILWIVFRPPTLYLTGDMRLVSATTALEVDAAISPDGRLVAYAVGRMGRMRIFVRQRAGGVPLPRSEGVPGSHRWPRWSPDGTHLVFVALAGPDDSVATSLQVVPTIGGTPRKILSARQRLYTPTWSRDGTVIAFSDGGGILVIPSDGGGTPRRLVSGDQFHSPVFSPDGTQLAFVAGNLLGEFMFNIAGSSIRVIPANGGNAQPVTDSIHGNWSPAWSADGRSVLYVSDATGEREVYQQPLNRKSEPVGRAHRLTAGLGAMALSLSADGRFAAYSVVRLRSQVFQADVSRGIDSALSGLKPVTAEAQAIEGLDVSRDGKWLVFDSNRDGSQDIYKVALDANTGEAIRLTTHPAADLMPQWSPDGREIAYYSMRNGNRDIRVMTADGRDDRAVTSDTAQESYPLGPPMETTSRMPSDTRPCGRL
jgi:serine/threonine-protein kinase